ncbi:hypothetical protein BpHYR1_035698 [Brachionus plicatilis]|uniref:Uncharacterized protein n=1 Tax=Brachionus plicatilis TaxID=10195 RepID=A0A3M7Q1H4_BRAPC|nr:hypothetical protein BpHYR1_035698 [Brachionus plicatilis]
MIEESMTNPAEAKVGWSHETENQVTEAHDYLNSNAERDLDNIYAFLYYMNQQICLEQQVPANDPVHTLRWATDVTIDETHEPTDQSRLEESNLMEATNRETKATTESAGESVSTPNRGIELYPKSQISVLLDTCSML